MPAKADLYAELMKEYYRLEESVLAQASAGLTAAGAAEAGRVVIQLAVAQLRGFVVKALQSQALRLSEIEEALSLTGDSLATAQLRMEGMEKENSEAAAVLFKMKVRSELQPQTAQAQELAEKLIEQEKLLQKREGEMSALRRKIQEAQSDRAGLLRRLEAEERRAAAAEPPMPAPPSIEIEELGRRLQAAESAVQTLAAEKSALMQRLQQAEAAARQKEAEKAALDQRLAQVEPAAVAELQRLGGLLAEARALSKQREAEQAALASRLAQAESESAAAREAMTAPKTLPHPPDEVPTLRARLAELERRLAEPAPDVEALRGQLKEEETFRNGLLQRIQALEGARYRDKADAKIAASKIAAAEKTPWTQERAELEGRLAAAEKELHRLRAINENSRSECADTLARQDALRLDEIAGLKRELEKLRADGRTP
jgi:chromosome segregation ATPase